jgi:hypothetical protein
MKQDKVVPISEAGNSVLDALRHQLAVLAAELDVRFVHAGTTLGIAIDTITRMARTLERIVKALDEQTAGAAVRTLADSAGILNALPAIQAERVSDITVVRRATNELHANIMSIQEMMSVLRVNGTSLRIVASASSEIAALVNELFDRFDFGDLELEAFAAELRDLASSVASVQRVARLVAAECNKLIPLIPDRLADDAFELQSHQAVVAECAVGVSGIARSVQNGVGVALCALQIGDITRQRIEHIVGALQLITGIDGTLAIESAAAAHVMRLFADQLTDVADEFEQQTGLLLGGLANLAPDAVKLQSLLEACGADADGRTFLHKLDGGIVEVDALTEQLRMANERAHQMCAMIADRLDGLNARAEAARATRAEIHRIALAAQDEGDRIGHAGRRAVPFAREISLCADQLGEAVTGVGWAIRELGQVSLSIRHRGKFEEQFDARMRLAVSLADIHEACRSTERGIGEGGLDAGELIETLEEAGVRLRAELGLGGTIRGIADALRILSEGATPADASGLLADLLPQVARFYSMTRERDIHRRHLLPGMEWHDPSEMEVGDDGLF